MKALGSEIRPRGPAPALGQDNRWLLEAVLGMDAAQADDILSSDAMG